MPSSSSPSQSKKKNRKEKKIHQMAKSVIILISTVCLISLLGSAYCEGDFYVEGRVYCDTCRTEFITRITSYMKGAKVRLECKDYSGNLKYSSAEVETDESGSYRVPVEGDHEEEVCEVTLVKSSDPDCSEVDTGGFQKESARITLTKNNGIATPVRQANPLGFLKKDPLPECAEVLRELGITKDGEAV